MKVLELLPIVPVLIMLYVKFAGNNLSVTLEYTTDAVLQNVKRSCENKLYEKPRELASYAKDFLHQIRILSNTVIILIILSVLYGMF